MDLLFWISEEKVLVGATCCGLVWNFDSRKIVVKVGTVEIFERQYHPVFRIEFEMPPLGIDRTAPPIYSVSIQES